MDFLLVGMGALLGSVTARNGYSNVKRQPGRDIMDKLDQNNKTVQAFYA